MAEQWHCPPSRVLEEPAYLYQEAIEFMSARNEGRAERDAIDRTRSEYYGKS